MSQKNYRFIHTQILYILCMESHVLASGDSDQHLGNTALFQQYKAVKW